MSFLFAFFFFLPNTSTAAAIRCPHGVPAPLLRCNLPLGPLQEIYVYRKDSKLLLCELNSIGSLSGRELSQREWNEKNIQLNAGAEISYDKGVLKFQSNDWFYQYRGIYGNADCWIGG